METIEFPINGGVTIIDEGDLCVAHLFGWNVWTSTTKGSQRSYATGSVMRGGRRCSVRLHRLIARPRPGLFVDHINGNGLDNRRVNLRVCSHKENTRNRDIHSWRDLPKGVSRTQRGRPFVARIAFDGRIINIGRYDTPDDAARAYDKAASFHFGQFARLNFPAVR